MQAKPTLATKRRLPGSKPKAPGSACPFRRVGALAINAPSIEGRCPWPDKALRPTVSAPTHGQAPPGLRCTSVGSVQGSERYLNRGALGLTIKGRAESRAPLTILTRPEIQAAFFTFLTTLPSTRSPEAISIRRGFSASGTSRCSSIFSMPFTWLAPDTRTWSARWNRR